MRTLLFGNGLNIQFGGRENTNKEILIRAMKKCRMESFPNHIIIDEGELLISLLGNLFLELSEILKGNYYSYAISTDEKNHLKELRNKYSSKDTMNFTDIGFEDYYLIFDLMCNKIKIVNPDRYQIREALKRLFILSIYNDGDVNVIFKKFPESLRSFFNYFDCLFTTNYDQNIEEFTGREVCYLHGSFKIRNDIYNDDSFRNKLSDKPVANHEIDEEFYFLYSNVLTTYNGNYKLSSMRQAGLVNDSLKKFSSNYRDNLELRDTVDNWLQDDSDIMKSFAESIILKVNDDSLKYEELYPINEFKIIEGELWIVGLSPFNDTHIFDFINENKLLTCVKYFYYSIDEIKIVDSLLINFDTEFLSVSELWNKYR